MKRSLALVSLATAMLMAFSTMAQDKSLKLGHINADKLLQQMPETKEAQKKLEEYGRQLEKDLEEMEGELQSKVTKFRSNEKMMTSLARETKTEELQNLQRRIQEYGQRAQQDLQDKQAELLNPVIDKATEAIETVAKENGYTYVFDSSESKAVIIYHENGDDLMPLVKQKLGLTQ